MLSTSWPLFEPFLTLIQYLLGKGHLEIPSKYTWFKTLGEHLHVLWNFRLSLKHFSLCQELHPMNHSWKGSHTPHLRLLRAHPWPQALQGWGTHSSIHLPLHTHSWDCPDATPCTCWTSLCLGAPRSHMDTIHLHLCTDTELLTTAPCCTTHRGAVLQGNTAQMGTDRGFQWQFWPHPLNAVSQGVWYHRVLRQKERILLMGDFGFSKENLCSDWKFQVQPWVGNGYSATPAFGYIKTVQESLTTACLPENKRMLLHIKFLFYPQQLGQITSQ